MRLRQDRAYAGILAELNSGRVRMTTYVNANASRTLEPDPEKQITDPAAIRQNDIATAK